MIERHGHPARPIYRTVQHAFGDESPANMTVKRPVADRILVYVAFTTKDIDRDEVEVVYAYPEAIQEDLPMLEKTRLNLPKVDLERIAGRYRFQDLDDLKQHWTRVLGQ